MFHPSRATPGPVPGTPKVGATVHGAPVPPASNRAVLDPEVVPVCVGGCHGA